MAIIHIIGTGLAGLSAATTLVRAGHYVQLYEASQHAGGRCALLRDEHRNDGYDGCNALLFGGNRLVLRYAEQLGSLHSLQWLDHGQQVFDAQTQAFEKRSAFLLPPALPLLDVFRLISAGLFGRQNRLNEWFDYYDPLSETYIEPLSRSLMLASPHEVDTDVVARRLWSLMRRGKRHADDGTQDFVLS